MVFAEGEEDRMIRAANSYAAAGLGTAILIGREEVINTTLKSSGIELNENVEVLNARLSDRNVDYANYLYGRLQRDGMLYRDCQRLANQDFGRNNRRKGTVIAGCRSLVYSGTKG